MAPPTSTPTAGVIAPARCIAGRDLTGPLLSPDGSMVLVGTSARSGPVLAVVPTAGGPERLLAVDPAPRTGRGLGGGCADWLVDGSGVVFSAADGDLWVVPVGAGDARRLTDDARGWQAPVVSTDGRHVAAVIDMAEVWVVDLLTADARRVDDGADAFVADPAWSPDGTVLAWQAWSPPHMAWDESVVVVGSPHGGVLRRLGPAGSQSQQPRFAPDGTLVRLCDATGWLNVWWGDEPLVDEPAEHGGPTWGLGQRSYAVSPDGSQVAFTRNERGFGRLCVVDVATRHVREIARAVHGHLDWRGNRLVALRTGARTPTCVVSYDMTATESRRSVHAIGPVAGWDGEPACVEPELVTAEASDGTVLHARLHRPAAGGDGRMIAWVHGGPTDQWPVTFMPRIAHWVSRGVTVLVPDHRGSTGHGRAYQQAMRGRWGEIDVEDVATLIRAAHTAGAGVPDRTVLMGSSAGGMTALLVAAHHAGLACAVAVAYPVCDISALDATTHRFEAHYNDTLIGPGGDPAAVRARHDRSPLAHAAALAQVPLLVLHGDSDPVVPVDQSERLVDAVRATGGDAELVVYPGEGHGFRLPTHQLDEYLQVIAFVDRHTGPRT